MRKIAILTEADLKRLVPLDAAAVTVVEDAFRALATEAVAMPPILRLDIPEHRGEVDVKTAYVPGLDHFAIKISPGFFDNPKLGLPSTNGMMVVLSSRTGLVEALLLDNGYLTDVRTAAAGAVAAKHLSREGSAIVTVFGAGMQARMQVRALSLVRSLSEVRIVARDPAKAQAAADHLTASLPGLAAHAVTDPTEAVCGADIIITTTPSEKPLLQAAWLAPGQHVTAMGSDAEHKNEVEPAVFDLPDFAYVADRLSQTRLLGELHHAIAAGLVSSGHAFPELGEVIAGKATGRSGDTAITLADLTGTGIQDTAIASFALSRAKAALAGTTFDV